MHDLQVSSLIRQLSFHSLAQWSLTFTMLWPFNTVHGVMTPNHKIISLLLHNCNFVTVINHNVNIWYAGYLTWDSQRGQDRQVEKCCSRECHLMYKSYWLIDWYRASSYRPGLASNFQFSYFSLQNGDITGMCHHTFKRILKSLKKKPKLCFAVLR